PRSPAAPIPQALQFISRPWDLLPAGLFLFAALAFRRRFRKEKNGGSLYDYSLFIVASLNVACHIAAAFSRHLLDGPFFLAELSKTASYIVMLCGALLDQARLFDQVRTLAVSDPLPGLATYRRLISVMEAELDRSRRTQRPFSVVLFDMDGLKGINDQFGHLTGSRAIVRLGKVLRNHSRAIDTAARYGGDEFALVLPEAGPEIATRVLSRIRERLAGDTEQPALSASAGVAAFPEDGDTPEKLLAAADRALYRMKHGGGSSVQNLSRIAACLWSRVLRSPLLTRNDAENASKIHASVSPHRAAYPDGDSSDARWTPARAGNGIDVHGERQRARRASGQCAAMGTERSADDRVAHRRVSLLSKSSLLPGIARRRLCNRRGVPRAQRAMGSSIPKIA